MVDALTGTIKMRIRLYSPCLGRLPFCPHARKGGRKRRSFPIVSMPKYVQMHIYPLRLHSIRSLNTYQQICKLYLYNNEHSLALSHHNSHLRKFADLSRGWGIGEETFEFWSWLARQCVLTPIQLHTVYGLLHTSF